MKIAAEVTRVETTGDSLRVTMQGKPPRSADWHPLAAQIIEVPDHPQTRRAFYVGRRVTIEVIL